MSIFEECVAFNIPLSADDKKKKTKKKKKKTIFNYL